MKKSTVEEIQAGLFILAIMLSFFTVFFVGALTATAIFDNFIEAKVYQEVKCN